MQRFLERTGVNTFHGYESTLITDAKVVAILDGDKQIDELGDGDRREVLFSIKHLSTRSRADRSVTAGN